MSHFCHWSYRSHWGRDLGLSPGLVAGLLLVWFLIDVYWRPHSLVDDDGRLVVLAGGRDVDWVGGGGGVVLLGRAGGPLVGLEYFSVEQSQN